jgi:LPS sulfotransferase NodH
MTTGFILLATQRTGSSWVQEMLNSHPDVAVYNELFLQGAQGYPLWEPNDIEFANTFLQEKARTPMVLTRRYWTIKFLDRIFDQPSVQAAGFKLMYRQALSSPEVLPYVAVKRIAVIHLVRRNLLDVVISSKLAEASGIYHVAADGRPPLSEGSQALTELKIRLEPAEVISRLTRLAREVRIVSAWLKMTRTPTCEVVYEELVADLEGFGRILNFLGLEHEATSGLRSALQKRNVAPRSEVIENLEEIESRLSGTPFESFLRDRDGRQS